MKKLVLAIVAVGMVGTCTLSQPGPMRGKLGRIFKELKLTDQQQKDLEKVKADMMKSMIASGSKIATSRVDLQQLFKADNPDKAAIEKKIDEMGDQAAQMGKMMVAQWFAVNKMLTPEQQKIWTKALNAGPMTQAGAMHGMMQGGRMQGPGMMRGQMMKRKIEIRERDGEKDQEEEDEEEGK
jgi:Spy/CpxP family protein refolding chaperone